MSEIGGEVSYNQKLVPKIDNGWEQLTIKITTFVVKLPLNYG